MEITSDHPVVRDVHPDSPGHRGGFAPGDVIVEVNGRDSREAGATVFMPEVHYTIRVRRGEDERELVLVPGPPRSPATPSTP
jgi:S1-C subfamily serine protease